MLHPKHPLSGDILSYFKQAASSTEESEQAEVLPQVPVAGLRRKFCGSKKETAKSSTYSTRSKGRNTKQQAKSKPQQQPTIIKAFAKYQQMVEHKENDEYLGDNILDNVWDFDASQPTPSANEETESNNSLKRTNEIDITESWLSPSEDKQMPTISTTTSVIPKTCGVKRREPSAASYSRDTAFKNKKLKLSQASPATRQQDDVAVHTLTDFDELAADQARKTTSTTVHSSKHQWTKTGKDDGTTDLEDTHEIPKLGCSTIAITDCAGEEELFGTALSSFVTTSTLTQQEREGIKATSSTLSSSPKLHDRQSITLLPSSISIATEEVLNFSSKDIDDMLFGFRTPSPVASPESEKDLASSSLQLGEYRDASCRLSDEEDTSLLTSRKRLSNSAADTGLEEVKFDDITNTVVNPQQDDDISPRKKSEDVLARLSFVDLTQLPGKKID